MTSLQDTVRSTAPMPPLPTPPRANAASTSWAVRGLRPWTLWIWLPCCYSLLIAPVADGGDNGHRLAAWLSAVAAALLFTGVVATRFRPGGYQDRIAAGLLTLLAILVVACTVAYSAAWSSAFVLLAIGVGLAVGTRAAPYAILLLTAGAVLTVLVADGSGNDAFSTGLTVLLSGFGTYAFHALVAVVAELRCTREELASAAVSEERERFARDLHDLLGHTLSVIVVKAEAVRRLVPHDAAAAAGHAADIEAVGREALTDVRLAASGYRGSGLDRELVRARSGLDAAGIALTVEQSPQPVTHVPEDTDALLGWVVREGVTNVLRHSQATRCTITLERTQQAMVLQIDNDAPTIECEPSMGAGLSGLKARVAARGGQLDVTQTQQGFRLAVVVPCTEEVASP